MPLSLVCVALVLAQQSGGSPNPQNPGVLNPVNPTSVSPYIPSGTWTKATHSPPGAVGASLLLTDGTVICQNPETNTWYKLTPDINGSYTKGTWSTIATMPAGYTPLYFGSAVLADGRVVVIGGEYNGGSGASWTNLAAVYTPTTNTWASLAAPSGWSQIGDCQCAVQPDGTLIIADPFNTAMARLNPTTMTWFALNSTSKRDRNDEEGWVLLRDGTILTCDAINSPNAERYFPGSDQWNLAGATPQSLEDSGSQELGPMVLRPDGTVFAMGATGHNAVYHPGATMNDPGSWTAAPDFPSAGGQYDIADGPAVLLPTGNVLCDASPGVFNTPSHFFEFNGQFLGQVRSVPRTGNDSSYIGNLIMLPSGQAMFTDFSNDVEIYTPVGTPHNEWRPTISSAPGTAVPGTTYPISGTQFNGLSQCSAYGDDSTNATNYPIIRVVNNATGHVFYCRTFNHSTMGVATGSLTVSTNFVVPTSAELGASKLYVVANGIPSQPVDISVSAGPGLIPGSGTSN